MHNKIRDINFLTQPKADEVSKSLFKQVTYFYPKLALFIS